MRYLLLFLLSLITLASSGQSLPQIYVTYDSLSTETFHVGTMTYIDEEGSIASPCLIRNRGGRSTTKEKKSFAIKLTDENGEKKDLKLAGLRNDNYWILNAAACDPSRVRDLVSWELWLDASRKPYHQQQEPKAINGSRGVLTEVWVNGSYNGVYVLMERIDRKQLKLKKFREATDSTDCKMRGVMYKAVDNEHRTPYFYYQAQPPVDSRPEWDGMEASYPDIEAGEPFSWQPLRDAVYYIASASRSTLQSSLEQRIDLPVFIDWELFKQLLAAQDNYGKNFYVWFYDYEAENKMGVTPWDLDWSWGSNSRSLHVAPDTEMYQQDNMQKRFAAYLTGYNQMLQDRWAELRQQWFVTDSLIARFDLKLDLLEATGAAERETERWDGVNNVHIDYAAEREYLHQWIEQRIAYLDNQYNYTAPDAIEEIQAERKRPTLYFDLSGRVIKNNSYLRNGAGIRIPW